jgi:hypothetical protein
MTSTTNLDVSSLFQPLTLPNGTSVKTGFSKLP